MILDDLTCSLGGVLNIVGTGVAIYTIKKLKQVFVVGNIVIILKV